MVNGLIRNRADQVVLLSLSLSRSGRTGDGCCISPVDPVPRLTAKSPVAHPFTPLSYLLPPHDPATNWDRDHYENGSVSDLGGIMFPGSFPSLFRVQPAGIFPHPDHVLRSLSLFLAALFLVQHDMMNSRLVEKDRKTTMWNSWSSRRRPWGEEFFSLQSLLWHQLF